MTQKIGKTAVLITGAAGGLGSALVRACSDLNTVDLVIAGDIRESVMQQFHQFQNVKSFLLDVGSEKSIGALKEQLEKEGITVKYLINNAGVNRFFAVSEATESLLHDILRVNLYGTILTVSVFLDHLVQSKGRVIQISSDSVRLAIPFHPYPSSKIALEAFSKSMRRELKLLGIDLVMIRPGAISTNFIDDMKTIQNPVDKSRYTRWFNKFTKLANQHVGRQSSTENVARLVVKSMHAVKPGLYYSMNKNLKISLLNLFPEKFQDRLIRKNLSE